VSALISHLFSCQICLLSFMFVQFSLLESTCSGACSKSCGDCTSGNIIGNDNGEVGIKLGWTATSLSSKGCPSKFCY
jgi:hypothetical protein